MSRDSLTTASSPRSDGEFGRGWPVLLASFLGMSVCAASLIFYSAGIWVRPWQDEFGWSRTDIAIGTTIGALSMVVAAPFAGRLLDRFSIRGIASLSLLLLALGLFGVSRMQGSLTHFYLLSAFCGLVGAASSPLAFTRVINAWFEVNRGMALGISLTSTGVAAMLIPHFLTPYVADEGWRAGYLVLVSAILVVTPVVYLLMRDGPAKERGDDMNNERLHSTGLRLKDAARRREFWIIAILFLLVALGVGGLIPAFVPLLQDGGIGAAEAGRYAAIMGASVIAGRLLTGFLIDRLFAGYVTAAVFALVAAGLLALAIGGLDFAIVGAVALGFAIGCEVDLIGYFAVRYFGLSHYGVNFGVLYGLFQIGCGVGPILVGYIWDSAGSYDMALQAAALLLLASALLALALPKFSVGQAAGRQ